MLPCPEVAEAAAGARKKSGLAWPAVPSQFRRQPIRDALLAYLEKPRLVADIARHIGRPVPTTTGHLAAMRRLGLVKRLGYAVYGLSGWSGPVPSYQRTSPGLPADVRAKVRAALREPITFSDLVRVTGLREDDVRRAVRAFWMTGLVAGDEASGYRPMRALSSCRKKAGGSLEDVETDPDARRGHANAVRSRAA